MVVRSERIEYVSPVLARSEPSLVLSAQIGSGFPHPQPSANERSPIDRVSRSSPVPAGIDEIINLLAPHHLLPPFGSLSNGSVDLRKEPDYDAKASHSGPARLDIT